MRRRRRAFRLFAASLAMAGSAFVAGQSPAHAVGTGAGVLFGSGTISPGLTTVPTPQSFTFTTANLGSVPSVAAGASTNGGVFAGTVNCSFGGSSTLAGGETSAVGEGTGSGTCGTAVGLAGTSGSIACSVLYVRVGTIVEIVYVCSITVNGNPNNVSIEVGICLMIPTSLNPTTSYQESCQFPEGATNV
jgi:hypothetical protein